MSSKLIYIYNSNIHIDNIKMKVLTCTFFIFNWFYNHTGTHV